MENRSRIEESLIREFDSLEGAVAKLLGRFSKLLDAAVHCRVNDKQLSHYANPTSADRHMPIDVMRDLERAVGDPVVTRCLAAHQKSILFKIPDESSSRLWEKHQREIVEEGSEVFLKLTEALDDGRVTLVEASELLVEVDEALAAFASLRNSLKDHIEDSLKDHIKDIEGTASVVESP